MRQDSIYIHGLINHGLICLGFALVLCSCAVPQPAPSSQTMYGVPSDVPKTFDMDIMPATDGKYLIDGKQQTLRNIYWKIREASITEKPIKTILYHYNKQGTAMQYICYLMLAYNEKVATYYKNDGEITAVKMTSTSDMAFNYLGIRIIALFCPYVSS